jgi:RNA polymerase subunit RPABC4/transcription elongation factor Spt4
LEKKYCRYCRRLINIENTCGGCGKDDFQAIIITVQSSKNFMKGEPE